MRLATEVSKDEFSKLMRDKCSECQSSQFAIHSSLIILTHACTIYAIIPVKPLHRAKSRLARALKAPTRAALVRSIFSRTLDVIAQVERIDGVIVVSRDLTILELARQRNAIALAESESGLNSAITQAAQWAAKHHARAVIVIPVDLPLITAADLDAVIDRAEEERCVVIAPDRHEDGTNVLLVQPAGCDPVCVWRFIVQRPSRAGNRTRDQRSRISLANHRVRHRRAG